MTDDLPKTGSSAEIDPQMVEVITDHLDRELELDEVTTLLDTIYHHLVNTPLSEYPVTVFVTGSYTEAEFGKLQEGDKWKVEGVRGMINSLSLKRGDGEVYAYLMDEIPGKSDEWINAVIKFRALADIADCIICVTEHDQGGAIFEQGMIMMNGEYRQKTLLMRRNYEDEGMMKEHYSWMQSKGIFSDFDDRNRLISWNDPIDLFQKTEKIYEKFNEA